jgi:hypothetical protein
MDVGQDGASEWSRWWRLIGGGAWPGINRPSFDLVPPLLSRKTVCAHLCKTVLRMLDELSTNKRRAFYEVERPRVGGDRCQWPLQATERMARQAVLRLGRMVTVSVGGAAHREPLRF